MVTVGVEWINKFPEPCSNHELSYCGDGAVGFGSIMNQYGNPWPFNWGDGNAWETDWRDPKFGGDDANIQGGADSVEFAYLSTHGASGGNFFVAGFGSQHERCEWDTLQADLGNHHLSYLVVDTCESLQLPQPHLEWIDCFDGLHLLFGFTGNSSDSWWTSDRGYNFGIGAAIGQPLGDAWLDSAYSYWLDDEPVAMAPGVTANQAKDNLFNESLSWSIFGIPKDQIRWFWWKWRS